MKCPYEYAVYRKQEGEEALVIGVYVDDLLITGTSISVINKFNRKMNADFDMSNMWKLAYYLGIEVYQKEGNTELKQAAYARRLPERAGTIECNAAKYPMETKLQLNKDAKGKAVNPTQYKSLVGELRYLVHTRTDIAQGFITRFSKRF